MQGYQTGGIVNIAKIFWKTSGPSGGFDLIWDATSNVIAFICEGTSGTYGYQPGQPAIVMPRVAVWNTTTWDTVRSFTMLVLQEMFLMTNASATYTIVIEYHKIESLLLVQGGGWGA